MKEVCSVETSIRFFSGKNIKIEPGDMGILINITMPDGEVHLGVEPRRYFPISDIYKYISIVKPLEMVNENDNKDKKKEIELFIIREIANLDDNSQKALQESLDGFYMIPKIDDILSSKDIYGMLQWKVSTDRGLFTFDIHDLYSSIKQLPDGRILVIDSSDNRYEITDYKTLSKKGQSLLLGYL